MTGKISARHVLTPAGWLRDHAVHFGEDGVITSITADGFDGANAVGTLLPGMANVHTHSFQRAMAGLAERRGPTGSDDFWTWRKVMYRFLDLLDPDDIEAICAQVQMDMALAGYSASAEFHYVHHQPDGTLYADLAETSHRILAASRSSGVGLTHLPVLYTYGGLDKRALKGGQTRFGNDPERFARLYETVAQAAPDMPGDFRLGVAPHSLRAVDRAGLDACLELSSDGPVHIHAAEQVKEIEEVKHHLGKRPVRWLLDEVGLNANWCLIHATHIDDGETDGLARSGAVAGLCPTTEANLGDGIFPAARFMKAGGAIGIGSDSNIRLSVSEELRMLEVSQRLSHLGRTILSDEAIPSNGRYLYERAAAGGAQAIGRNAGAIAQGRFADLVALRDDAPFLDWAEPDQRLDSWIFGFKGNAVSDVWSAGRHIVSEGRHMLGAEIGSRFASTMRKLASAL
ncbi:formimidoylglutamate deiminase [Aurantiacibacter sp. D1-12]|uniref:formimidoylglutamate deiminase n=1 Tax=Aurantiacibacter sp. D1-12 TaxID=2993658 RepID=UPI00237C9022|nr:formimidoylglutamate deiminase [Aurantiacibacter sp. D1-12]MDE1467758.1 formimidoylglutamate deiminase [Aurantiacibacter sp. D1-12]